MDNQELKYWLGFSRIPGIGRARFSLLEQSFTSLSQAWQAPAADLERILDRKTLDTFVKRRGDIDLDEELQKLSKVDVKAYTWHDPEYPRLLREIDDLPPVLYVRGELLPDDEVAVAVVGTRKASAYGREATHRLVTDLVRSGVTIVSGLARGIDAAAHRAALEAGGRTIAVQGCGLDMVYPSDHVALAQEIIKHGALISDYPLGVRPEPSNFPRRNRILSGLSLGVLVVEADIGSGSEITVNLATEQGRDIFAVPGSIFSPLTRGTHRLLQEGAKLVTQADDILAELNLAVIGQQMELKAAIATTDSEKLLLELLSHEPQHIDDVGRRCGLSTSEVSSTLAMLELKGAVRQVGPMNFVLA